MEIPEKFPEVIRDFLADLSIAFPEYIYLWEQWQNADMDITPLYQYCLTMYPERFFDILYQNDEIFLSESESNTCFLPNVEFKMLFSAPGITENTKQAMWKYLQLVLITIMGNIKSSTSFGDTAGLFEGIGEDELQKKLAETITGLTDFFKNMPKDGSMPDMGEMPEMPDMDGNHDMNKAFEEMFNEMNKGSEGNEGTEGTESSIPNADDLHNHIKGLFDGKIGSLAKELAEEMSGEVMTMFDDGTGEIKDTSDILKKMMRNPKQIMELVKKIGSKIDDKMKSGSISQQELMKEAGDLMSKMKGMGNGKEFQNMMKNMMKSMGGAGVPKGGQFDMNRMSAMMNQNAQKDKLKSKLEQRRNAAMAAAASAQANYTLESTAPNEFVFKLPEDGVQEKSKAPVAPINDDWLDDEPTPVQQNKGKGKAKGKKGKKGK